MRDKKTGNREKMFYIFIVRNQRGDPYVGIFKKNGISFDAKFRVNG